MKQLIIAFTLLFICSSAIPPQKPIALHPAYGHYFLFRGKPTAVITSGEHYGAVEKPRKAIHKGDIAFLSLLSGKIDYELHIQAVH
jgi:hypothetical protein